MEICHRSDLMLKSFCPNHQRCQEIHYCRNEYPPITPTSDKLRGHYTMLSWHPGVATWRTMRTTRHCYVFMPSQKLMEVFAWIWQYLSSKPKYRHNCKYEILPLREQIQD